MTWQIRIPDAVGGETSHQREGTLTISRRGGNARDLSRSLLVIETPCKGSANGWTSIDIRGWGDLGVMGTAGRPTVADLGVTGRSSADAGLSWAAAEISLFFGSNETPPDERRLRQSRKHQSLNSRDRVREMTDGEES
jgi:hypothetical protein